jgi:tetratricopeptide (TPR) repeat protein
MPLLPVLLAAFLVAASRVAAAAPPPAPAAAADPAESLIQRGLELMREARFEDALHAFQEAHKLHATRRAVAEEGLAEAALHRWVRAEEHLALAVDDPDDPWIKKNQGVLDDALGEVRQHIGTIRLDVRTATPGLSLYENGQWVPWLPSQPILLAEGRNVLELRANGFESWKWTVRIVGGSGLRFPVELAPVRVESAPPPSVRAPSPAPAPTETPSLSRGAPGWLSLTLAIGGAAAAGYGGYLLAIDGQAECDSSGICPSVKQTRLPGTLLLGAGITAALTGVVLFVWRPSETGRSVAAGPMVLRVRF